MGKVDKINKIIRINKINKVSKINKINKINRINRINSSQQKITTCALYLGIILVVYILRVQRQNYLSFRKTKERQKKTKEK